MGPKGENAQLLEDLVVEAVRDQAFWRRNFHPSDPSHITEEARRSHEFLEAMDSLKSGYQELLAFLKKSVPFFSMRYQGHMNWDLTIPGIVGYFAAMLYNPNNVAFEGSTATTLLELLVGDDLCRMLGYHIPAPDEIAQGAIRPWGHITCDGTVANIEAIWSARNLKLYPVALREALRQEEVLAGARGIMVPLPAGGTQALVDMDNWTILNLRGDDILALPARLSMEFGIERQALTDVLSQYALQNLGFVEFNQKCLGDGAPSAVFLVPGTKHYSFPKAAALLGIGSSNMLDIAVDEDGRADISALEGLLQQCLRDRRPVYTVVAVMGTTEESAIDPLHDIVALRDRLRAQGLEFTIHADAAWGGYHVSVIREDFDMPQPGFVAVPPPAVPLSRYVTTQFQALGQTDSITVDPHKSGYIPYPAGALCYRNSAMRDLVTFSAPVVYHGEAEPTVGIYGIEGSKPGAAAASVYLSHRVIRPSRSGYGKIIGQALFSCKKLYARLLTMAGEDDRFIVTPLPRLPAERQGGNVEAERRFIRERIVGRSNQELSNDAEAMALLAELGPDENILSYAFNLRLADGSVNTDLALANQLNATIYNHLSIDPGRDIYGYNLIVSTTDLDAVHYGPVFIEALKRRMGVAGSAGSVITVLRSVVMDPWVTETTAGSFLDVLEQEFRTAVNQAIDAILQTGTRGY